MTGALISRWRIVAAKLREAREQGRLGIIAASLKIAEYKLHDLAKLEESNTLPISAYELRKLCEYFEVKKS